VIRSTSAWIDHVVPEPPSSRRSLFFGTKGEASDGPAGDGRFVPYPHL
jgi:hypothetical protein